MNDLQSNVMQVMNSTEFTLQIANRLEGAFIPVQVNNIDELYEYCYKFFQIPQKITVKRWFIKAPPRKSENRSAIANGLFINGVNFSMEVWESSPEVFEEHIKPVIASPPLDSDSRDPLGEELFDLNGLLGMSIIWHSSFSNDGTAIQELLEIYEEGGSRKFRIYSSTGRYFRVDKENAASANLVIEGNVALTGNTFVLSGSHDTHNGTCHKQRPRTLLIKKEDNTQIETIRVRGCMISTANKDNLNSCAGRAFLFKLNNEHEEKIRFLDKQNLVMFFKFHENVFFTLPYLKDHYDERFVRKLSQQIDVSHKARNAREEVKLFLEELDRLQDLQTEEHQGRAILPLSEVRSRLTRIVELEYPYISTVNTEDINGNFRHEIPKLDECIHKLIDDISTEPKD